MRLGLGTVQFGSDYGISNSGGQVPAREVAAVLETAAAEGLEVLDTAAAYGEAEAVLGRALREGHPFRIVTKTAPLPRDSIGAKDVAQVLKSFHRSLERLRTPRVYALMVHHASALLRPGGEALAALMCELKDRALVAKIGFSCYSVVELQAARAVLEPDIVQLPCSVLDRRFTDSGTCAWLKARGVEIHARSLFLQGLLLIPTNALPRAFDAHRPVFERIDRFAAAHGVTRLALALGYARARSDIDVAIVGVTSQAELKQILDAMREPRAASLDYGGLGAAAEELLNPSLWTQSEHVAMP